VYLTVTAYRPHSLYNKTHPIQLSAKQIWYWRCTYCVRAAYKYSDKNFDDGSRVFYQNTVFDRRFSILIAGGISLNLLIVTVSTLHVLTWFGRSHSIFSVWFSAFAVFVRPLMVAWSCFCFSHSCCAVWFSDCTVCVRLSFVCICSFKLLMTPSGCWCLDLNSFSSNFSDLKAASEKRASVISCSCS
jgi:hypothetical protein